MDINDMMAENRSSIQSAISTTMLRKSMSQDAVSMANLLAGMVKANNKVTENMVRPHLGGNFDQSV